MTRLKDLFSKFDLENDFWIYKIANDTDKEYKDIKLFLEEIKSNLDKVEDVNYYYICIKQKDYDIYLDKNDNYRVKYINKIDPFISDKNFYKIFLNEDDSEIDDLLYAPSHKWETILGCELSPNTENNYTELEIVTSFMRSMLELGSTFKEIENTREKIEKKNNKIESIMIQVDAGIITEEDAKILLDSELNMDYNVLECTEQEFSLFEEAEENVSKINEYNLKQHIESELKEIKS